MCIISVELKTLAESYLRQGHSQKALDLYMGLLTSITDPPEVLSLKISISKIHVLLSDYTAALTYATESSLLALKMNRQEDIAQTYQLIGSIHFRLKNLEKSIPYFEYALQLYIELCDFEKMARVSNNIGVAYLDLENFNQAEKYFTNILELSHLIAEPYPIGLAYTNRGEVYLKQHQFDQAIVNFFKAIDIYKDLEIALCIAYTYLRLSEAYMYKGYLILALEYAYEATRIQTTMHDQYELSSCYLHLSKLYELQSNFNKALHYYKCYSKIELDLATKNTHIQVTKLEEEFKAKEQFFYKQKTLELENINHELQIAYEQIKELSLTDTLTELLNRRGFLERLTLYEKETTLSPRSLLIIDIDNFKHINDTYGHVLGDKVLIYTSRILKNTFKDIGIVCRYGGEEFIIFIPHCDLTQAQILAETLAYSIAKDCLSTFSFRYTVTIGINTSSTLSLEEQINLADKCLYAGKHSTKNCIVCSTA